MPTGTACYHNNTIGILEPFNIILNTGHRDAGCCYVEAAAEETEPVNQHGADFTVRDITSALFKAKPGERLPPDCRS